MKRAALKSGKNISQYVFKGLISIIVAFSLIFVSLTAIQAATFTSVASGAWTTNTNWSPVGVPGVNDIVIINHAITRATGTYTSWNGTSSITINNGGSLSVTGNLTFAGSGSKIIVNTGGALSASGTFTLNNQSSVTMNGGQLNTGSMVVGGGSYTSSSGAITNASSLNVTNSGSTSFTNGGTFNVNGAVTVGGTITNNGTMNVAGDYTFGGGGSSVTNQYGNLNIVGSVSLPSSAKFRSYPGSVTVVDTNVTTSANENLIVGTSANPPPYADFIIKGDLISQGSGDILVDSNGRLAVFGDFYSTGGGGSIFTVNDGGMVYVAGDITFNGGGDHLTNNNNGVPYGFYSPNDPVYNGGGGSSNGAAGSNSVQDIDTMEDEAPDFFDWVANIPGSPLPVELLYFYVEKKTDGVVLHWATASELNFDRFVIEKTRDGKTFVEIGERQGAGVSTTRIDYSFTDENVLLGRTYYRLKAIDFDGFTEYFGIVTATFEGAEQIMVAPNPAVGNNVKFQLNYSTEGALYYRVLNASGGEVFSSFIESNGFESEYAIPKTLTSGLYFLVVQQGQERKMVRFVVR